MSDEENRTNVVDMPIDRPQIMLSTWCVECPIGKGKAAQYIYEGNGLCRKHFGEKVGLK